MAAIEQRAGLLVSRLWVHILALLNYTPQARLTLSDS